MISKIAALIERYAFYLLLPLIIFFCFFRLGNQPVHQWDEARTGINAIEMLENGDFVNLYFGGEPDKIRAKPPLVIWLVAANFKIFGPSAWSLRLHSAIASVFIFLFVFLIARLYESGIFALACSLILLSVRGIIGFHVGRTGDFDAVLVAFLLGGLYYFLKYLTRSGGISHRTGVRGEESGVRSQESGVRSQESGIRSEESGIRSQESGVRGEERVISTIHRQPSTVHHQPSTINRPPSTVNRPPSTIYLAALFWGLAFLTKGPAMGVLFPGLILFLLLTRQLKPLLRRREVYIAGALCLVFPISWYLIVHFFGIQLERPEVSGRNAFERMFLYDLVDRFTQTEFEGKTETSDALFFFSCLKENFAIWHYLFYATIMGGIACFFKDKGYLKNLLNNHLLVLSVAIWFTLGLFLSMVTTAKFWYLAPAIPFVAITLVYGLKWLEKRFTPLPYLFLTVWVISMYFRYLGPKPQPTEGSETPDFFTDMLDKHQSVLKQSDRIFITPQRPAQSVLLQLHFINEKVQYSNDPIKQLKEKDVLFVRNSDTILKQLLPEVARLDSDEHYTILQKQ